MYYSNKEQINPEFKCILCGEGEHGLGNEKHQVCFKCIRKLVEYHDYTVRDEFKIIKNVVNQ